MAHVNLTEAAKLAGVHRSTLRRHIKQGKIEARQGEDGKLRVDSTDLQRLYGDTSNARAPTDGAPDSAVRVEEAVQGAQPVNDGAAGAGAPTDGAPDSGVRVEEAVHDAQPVNGGAASARAPNGGAPDSGVRAEEAVHDAQPVNGGAAGARAPNGGAPEIGAPEAELRVLRAQIARMIEEWESEEAQHRKQIDRLTAERDRLTAEYGARIEHLEAAVRQAPQGPTAAYPFGGLTRHSAPAPMSDPESLLRKGDLDELRSGMMKLHEDIRDWRNGVGSTLHGIETRLPARSGFLYRATLSVPVAWCLVSGAYLVGFWQFYGLDELVRVGRVSFGSLYASIWSLWPL